MVTTEFDSTIEDMRQIKKSYWATLIGSGAHYRVSHHKCERWCDRVIFLPVFFVVIDLSLEIQV